MRSRWPRRARIDAAATVALVVYPGRRSFLEAVTDPFGASSTDSRATLGVLTRASAMLAQLRRYRPGEPLMLMPNVFWR